MTTAIGVFGHSPDEFGNKDSIQRSIDDAIVVIQRQHKNNPFTFLIGCEPGVSQWFCKSLFTASVSYELYLAGLPTEISKNWLDEQRDSMFKFLDFAKSIHIFCMDNNPESRITRDRKIVDDANWCLFFWNGKHQGFTYNAMKYAIENNKIVYNGFDAIQLIDKESFIIK